MSDLEEKCRISGNFSEKLKTFSQLYVHDSGSHILKMFSFSIDTNAFCKTELNKTFCLFISYVISLPPKDLIFTIAGVNGILCGSPKKSPRTSP